MQTPRSHIIKNIFFAVFAFFIAQFFLWYVLRVIPYPYSTDYTEGHVLALSALWHDQGTYFFAFDQYPLIHAAYTPWYIFLNALAWPVAGPTYVWGRIISLAATLGIVLLLYQLVYRISARRDFALFLALLFLVPEFVIRWSVMARPDMLAHALSLLGLFIFWRFYPTRSRWRYAALLVFLLAFLTKQNAVAALGAVIIFSLVKDRSEFYRLAGLTLGLFGITFAVFEIATGGQFIRHTFGYMYAISPLRAADALESYQYFFRLTPLFVGLIFINLLFYKRFLLFSAYWLVNAVFFIIQSKPGANINLAIEFYLSTLLLGGLLICHVLKRHPSDQLVMIGLLLLELQVVIMMPFPLYWQVAKNPGLAVEYSEPAIIDYHVSRSENPILSEDLGVVAMNRKDIIFEPFTFSQLSRAQAWNDARLVSDCSQKKFTLAVVGNNLRQLPNLFTCLEDNYQLLEDLGNYDVYIPKSETGPVPAEASDRFIR